MLSIDAVLRQANRQLSKVRTQYQQALIDKIISEELQCDIKDYLGNVRSPLDYVAKETMSILCLDYKSKVNFPFCNHIKDYNKHPFSIIQHKNGALWKYIESIQPYHIEYKWLSDLNKLNNDHKHQNLVPQTKINPTRIFVDGPDTMPIVIIAQGKVILGVGANINGAIFDGEKLVAPDGYTVEHVQWIDFIFEGIDISAFTFLSNSLIGVTKIIDNIRKLLQYK